MQRRTSVLITGSQPSTTKNGLENLLYLFSIREIPCKLQRHKTKINSTMTEPHGTRSNAKLYITIERYLSQQRIGESSSSESRIRSHLKRLILDGNVGCGVYSEPIAIELSEKTCRPLQRLPSGTNRENGGYFKVDRFL